MLILLPLGCILMYHYDGGAGFFARLLYGLGGILCVGSALGLGFFSCITEAARMRATRATLIAEKV
jgi:hypothetical protein